MGRRVKGKRYQDTALAAVVEDVKEGSGDESTGDDSSQSSSSTSSDSSSEDSPTPSDLNDSGGQDAVNKTASPNSKTWDSMDGYEVRQNALKLLNESPVASEKKKGSGERKMNSVTYQSYQDSSSSPSMAMERPPHFSSTQTSAYAPSAHPPWGDSRYNANNDIDDDSLSVYHVASLTFNCMVHCLTEGYRAASTYYNSGYPEDSASSPIGGFQSTSNNTYEVGSYQDNGYSGAVGGGQSQYREVMDRDTSQPRSLEGTPSSNRDRGNYQSETPQRGDYTAVKLPSTYQSRSAR